MNFDGVSNRVRSQVMSHSIKFSNFGGFRKLPKPISRINKPRRSPGGMYMYWICSFGPCGGYEKNWGDGITAFPDSHKLLESWFPKINSKVLEPNRNRGTEP